MNLSQFTCYSYDQPPYNAHSGTNRIYANTDGTATFSFANPTVFSGAYIAGVPGGTGPVSFTLFLGGSQVANSSGLTVSDVPTFLASGYSGNVDAVQVNGANGFYVLDDITLGGTSTVPEPGSMALLGTGLVGLVPMLRRRRR